MRSSLSDWRAEVKSAELRLRADQMQPSQSDLFPAIISTRLPLSPIGKDLAFVCVCEKGDVYYAKTDKDGRRVRATEWIATKTAEALGLSVADSAILQSSDGETYFGSRQPTSLADAQRCERFLRTRSVDEIGRPSTWLGQFLSRVWAFDTFIDNPDRILQNFVLEGQTGRIRAIDFASARFLNPGATNFPIASENTVIVGKHVRGIHGVHRESAFELLDWLGSMASATIAGIVDGMPKEWLSEEERGRFFEAWSADARQLRAARVRALIEHDW